MLRCLRLHFSCAWQEVFLSCLDIRDRFETLKNVQQILISFYSFVVSDSLFDLLVDVFHLGLPLLSAHIFSQWHLRVLVLCYQPLHLCALPSSSCAAPPLHQPINLFAFSSSSCAAAAALFLQSFLLFALPSSLCAAAQFLPPSPLLLIFPSIVLSLKR